MRYKLNRKQWVLAAIERGDQISVESIKELGEKAPVTPSEEKCEWNNHENHCIHCLCEICVSKQPSTKSFTVDKLFDVVDKSIKDKTNPYSAKSKTWWCDGCKYQPDMKHIHKHTSEFVPKPPLNAQTRIEKLDLSISGYDKGVRYANDNALKTEEKINELLTHIEELYKRIGRIERMEGRC